MNSVFVVLAVISVLAFKASALGVTERCSSDEMCEPPLSCVGNPENLRCFMKKGLGMRCGNDPFWVCESGLVCDNGTCKMMMGKKGRCGTPDTVCKPPLSCVGNPHNLRCFKKKRKGMACGKDPFWVCRDSLVCDTDGICKRPVGTRGRCGFNLRICTPPESCVGPSDAMRCMMKKPEGMPCGRDPYWVCEDGLVCENRICTVPV